MTPFEEAGYTEETEFKVLEKYGVFRLGDVVRLEKDDNSSFPFFRGDDVGVEPMYLPGYCKSGIEELEYFSGPRNEVEEEPEEIVDEVEAPPPNLRLKDTFKDYNHILVKLAMNGEKFNGHNQLCLGVNMEIEDLMEMVEIFEEELGSLEDYDGSICAKLYSDGSGSLQAPGWWSKDEHPMGHLDKNLISWGVE